MGDSEADEKRYGPLDGATMIEVPISDTAREHLPAIYGPGWETNPEAQRAILLEHVQRLNERISKLEATARRAAEIIDRNLYHQREKVEDARSILIRALEE